MSRVLAIGDIHAPFHHRDAFRFTNAVALEYACDSFVCLGDEVDAHTISRYRSDPSGMGTTEELRGALKELRKWYTAFPDMKVCTSNHTSRPYRKAFEAGIPKEFLVQYHDWLEAPEGWEWRDVWEVDGVRYEHGEGFSGMYAGRHAATARMQSTVIGHVHSNAGVHHINAGSTDIFGMNAGCLIDADKYAFAYAKTARVKPSLGLGVVINGVPLWIPMTLTKSGRWNNKIIA